MSDKKEDAIIGYLHNVSPIKKSARTPYFDMQIQTSSDVVRGVCFTSARQQEFKQLSEQKSPVKISKFKLGTKSPSKDILMNNTVHLEPLASVEFPLKLLPTTMNISSLAAVNDQQLVHLKAKVTQLSGVKKIKTREGEKKKLDAYLVDPHGCVKITVWEEFTTAIQEGGTYLFTNLRVRKDANTKELHLNTPRYGCQITESKPFDKPVASAIELPQSFVTTTINANILGVSNFSCYYGCCQCHKKLSKNGTPTVKCAHCGLVQKLASCTSYYLLHALVQVDSEEDTITLTFFDEIIKEIILSTAEPEVNLSEESVTNAVLNAPTLEITYNNRTKIVNTIKV